MPTKPPSEASAVATAPHSGETEASQEIVTVDIPPTDQSAIDSAIEKLQNGTVTFTDDEDMGPAKLLEELAKYPAWKWRSADRHGKHPSDLSKEFYDKVIADDQKDFERECKERGQTIMPREELDALLNRAYARFKK